MSIAQASADPTPAQREDFERDGYLILDSVGVAPETLDAIVDDLDGLYGEQHMEGGVLYAKRRIRDAWRISPNVKALALAPDVLGMLEALYGRRPIPFQTLNFWVGSQQAPHSDTLHFNSMPPGYMCGMWVALEDIDMDNGPVVFYPGSHKLPEVTMQDVGAKADKSEYGRYERHIAELMEAEGFEPQYATVRKGQALLWAANIVHGGSRLNDPKRTRHSQVTHYFFEDCRYYIPLHSEPDNIHWREAEPIA
jgi:ectoine hydroxylase-related dioxygenase (phytanoyl-CoA dioxygenase family)